MKALVLIDFEKEWVDENSDYFVGDISNVVNRTNRLIKFCRDGEYKIIFVKHIEEEGGAFIGDSENVEFIEGIGRRDSDLIVEKRKISSFLRTDMEKHLEGIDEVVVCGILTNLCVRSFVEDAYDRDFDIKVIRDCCVAFDKETQEFTFKDLKATREEVEFLDLKEFIV